MARRSETTGRTIPELKSVLMLYDILSVRSTRVPSSIPEGSTNECSLIGTVLPLLDSALKERQSSGADELFAR